MNLSFTRSQYLRRREIPCTIGINVCVEGLTHVLDSSACVDGITHLLPILHSSVCVEGISHVLSRKCLRRKQKPKKQPPVLDSDVFLSRE